MMLFPASSIEHQATTLLQQGKGCKKVLQMTLRGKKKEIKKKTWNDDCQLSVLMLIACQKTKKIGCCSHAG
jgi:hypothetical protein